MRWVKGKLNVSANVCSQYELSLIINSYMDIVENYLLDGGTIYFNLETIQRIHIRGLFILGEHVKYELVCESKNYKFKVYVSPEFQKKIDDRVENGFQYLIE